MKVPMKVWPLLLVALLGCDKPKPTAAPEEDAKFYISPDIEEAAILAAINGAAKTSGGVFARADKLARKCRQVSYLDSSDHVLRKRGYSLRYREKRRQDCSPSKKQNLAISFNHRGESQHAADAARPKLALAPSLPAGDIKRRNKQSTVVSAAGAKLTYVVGGTVRRLGTRPMSIADVAKLFPHLDLPAADLSGVNGRAFYEKNSEVGKVGAMVLELAALHPTDGDRISWELTVEHPIAAFVAALHKELAGKLAAIDDKSVPAYR